MTRTCPNARLGPQTDGRKVRALIAAESVDRQSDVLVATGAELAAYRRNPVLLWAHRCDLPPIGRALSLEIEPGVGLWAENEFAETTFARELFELYQGGYLNAFSVGFRPLDCEPRQDGAKRRGQTIWRWELVEQSAVPVPANPDALVAAAGDGNRTARWLLKRYFPQTGANVPQIGGPAWSPPPRAAARPPSQPAAGPTVTQPIRLAQGDAMQETMTELRAIADQIKRDHDPERLLTALRETLNRETQPSASAPSPVGSARHLAALDAGSGGADRPATSLRAVLARPARNDRERELQRLNDRVYLLSVLGRRDPRSLKSWAAWSQLSGELSRALNTVEAEEFVPEGFSVSLKEEVTLQRRVPSLFEQVSLPRSPLRWPVEGNIGLPYVVGEPTGDTPDRVPTRTPGTNEVTFDARTMGVRVPFSHEFEEDCIIACEDYVRRQIARSLLDGLESALLNGDTGSTHMDSVVSAANDVRRLVDGLRRLARRPSAATETDCATFSQATWLAARAKMGPYGLNPEELVCLLSVRGYYRLLGDNVGWPDFQTLDKVGPRAINLTGEVGALYGVPVVISSFLPENCSGAATCDGLGSDTLFVLANRRAFGLATQVGPTIETVWDAETLQYKVIGYQRVDFQPWFDPTSARCVSVGYNVDAS